MGFSPELVLRMVGLGNADEEAINSSSYKSAAFSLERAAWISRSLLRPRWFSINAQTKEPVAKPISSPHAKSAKSAK